MSERLAGGRPAGSSRPDSAHPRPGEVGPPHAGGDHEVTSPLQTTLRGAVRGVRFTGRTTSGAARSAGRWFQRSTRAEGAGESGLANLIDLHSVNSAADALFTVALANTLFFSVDVHQARSRVALYLLITMAPFAVVAPVVGPLLDRFRRGRRYALAATLVGRAFLAWVLAGAIATKSGLELYPAAFGALICSKAYGVTRSAVVPRVLPPSVTLVRGNARLTLWGILAATIAAPIGQGINWATGNPAWSLRLAAIVYLAGSAFAIKLPPRVDSNEGEARLRPRTPADGADADTNADEADLGADLESDAEARRRTTVLRRPRSGGPPETNVLRRILPPLRGVGPRMPAMLRANAGLRAFTGFLTLFLAFLVRTHPLGVFRPNVDLGFVVAAAAVGSVLGTSIGAWLKARRPEPLAIASLGAAAVMGVLTAIWFGLLTATLAMLLATLTQSIGKLGLDSVIQRDVAEDVRTSAFARSETALQLSWVLGGFLAIVLPSNGSLGLALGSLVLVAVLVITVRTIRVSPDRDIEVLRQRRAMRHADVGS